MSFFKRNRSFIEFYAFWLVVALGLAGLAMLHGCAGPTHIDIPGYPKTLGGL